jgi:pyruvate/2-oxoglutarate/acetoin dehydrogenase E1 component
VIPSTPYDAKGLFAHALRSDDPVLFLEHRELMGTKGFVPTDDYEIEFGRARIARSGSDMTVVALANMVPKTLVAAERLAGEAISAEVIDPRTVSPLDVDEALGPCGVGAEIAARVAESGFDSLDAPIVRLNGAFAPTPYSPALEESVVPQVEGILGAMRRLASE